MAGICLGVLYHFYYSGGDTLIYFQDATVLAQLASDNPAEYLKALTNPDHPILSMLKYGDVPRALFFVKVLSLINLLTASHYWLSGLYLSLFSFTGCWMLANQLSVTFPNTGLASTLAFLLLPSFVFWSSGIIKESVAIAALSICLFGFLRWIKNAKIQNLFIILLTWLLLWKLKYYYAGVLAAVMFPTVVIVLINRRYEKIKRSTMFPVWVGSMIIAVLAIRLLHPNFYFSRILEVVVENYDLYAEKTFSENLIQFYDLHPSLISLLINAPWALFSGLFRPLVFEGGSLIKILAGVENTMLLFLAIGCLSNMRRHHLKFHPEIVAAAGVYIAVMATFLALSVPNLGSLVRMKAGFLPFFWYMLLAVNPWTNRVVHRLKFKRIKRLLPLW